MMTKKPGFPKAPEAKWSGVGKPGFPMAGKEKCGTTPYLSRKPIRVFGPERPDLEVILSALHTEFVLRDSGERYRHVVDAWAAFVPEGVRRGEKIFRDGRLRRMREAGAGAAEVMRRLSAGVNGLTDRLRPIC